MVKGVIFDMDGTMFDTERLSTKGWIYAGKKAGRGYSGSIDRFFSGKKSTGDPKKILQHILETDWITIQRVQ
mgnify:CR=1 FL=1